MSFLFHLDNLIVEILYSLALWVCAACLVKLCLWTFEVVMGGARRLQNGSPVLLLLLCAMAGNGVYQGFAKTNGLHCVSIQRSGVSVGAGIESDLMPVDVARISSIEVTDLGVVVELHRPAVSAADAMTVHLCGSTNLVTATWEVFSDLTFPAGVTNILATVSHATLDAHDVTSSFFLAFIETGDNDGDGLTNWHERFNLKTSPWHADTDGDGMPDDWELANGFDPLFRHDGILDSDGDGVLNLDEYAAGTDPCVSDTDGDGLDDQEELGWTQHIAGGFDFSQNESTIYIQSPPQGMVASGSRPFDLPYGVSLCGRVCTRGVADIHGVVHFLSADDPAPPVLGENAPIPSSVLSSGVSVAAYWDSLHLRGGVSSIRLTETEVDGNRYVVVEYHDVEADEGSLLTFRVAVSPDIPDRVVVQYVSLNNPDEGAQATFGVQGPNAHPAIQVACNGPAPVYAGTSIIYHLGPGTDPLDPDTDGDELPDGWEVRNGLSATSSVGGDGAAGDPDGDDVTNWEEYVAGTFPLNPFSFSEVWSDADWISNGGGEPVEGGVSVVVRVGDPSSSASERWCLLLDDESFDGRHYVIPCLAGGEVALRGITLERGRTYVGTLAHLGSSRAEPDYDWTAQIDGWPQTTVLPAGQSLPMAEALRSDLQKGVDISNLDGLLGICNRAFDSYDNTVGKTFEITTRKTQVSSPDRVVPLGFVPRTPIRLTSDSDALADWSITPEIPGGARLFTVGSGGEGACAQDGVSEVYVSAGSVPASYTITARNPNYLGVSSSLTFTVCRFAVTNVRFNFSADSAAEDGINLRADYSSRGYDPSVGEWASALNVNFPACYIVGRTPKIQAKFVVEPAVDLSAVVFAGQTGDAPLPGVFQEAVSFVGGVSQWVTFRCAQSVGSAVTCGHANFGWRICGIGGVSFAPLLFAETGPHRIYTILAAPVEPWNSNDPLSNQCAWTNALEWACSTAAGATTENEAASLITRGINEFSRFLYASSGHRFVFEDMWSGIPYCDLSNCLNLLNGVEGTRRAFVDCTDCAAFVVSLSNVLGCSLYLSRMEADFDTNPIVVIGDNNWVRMQFIYHEVAWAGECGDADLVFDACLRYDGDASPFAEPCLEELPIAIPFSDGSELPPYAYREKLAAPGFSGYESCEANPSRKKRLEVR